MNFADQHRDGTPAWGITAELPGTASARWWLMQGHLNILGDANAVPATLNIPDFSVLRKHLGDSKQFLGFFKHSLMLQEFYIFTCMKCWPTVHDAESVRLTITITDYF